MMITPFLKTIREKMEQTVKRNLLILSPGRRVEIVEYFKEVFHEDNRRVYTLDKSPLAPALYSGDEYYCIEKDFNNLDLYIENIIAICKQKSISAIITLIDPELVLLSEHKEQFDKEGVCLILSDLAFIRKTFDKFEFYNTYKDIIKLVDTVGSYQDAVCKIDSNEWHYPLFAKLRNGSASIGIQKICCESDFEITKADEDYIYQPYISGTEYGVDAYFDMVSGDMVSVFIKKKLSMRAGETDKSVSVISESILDEVKKISKIKGLRGPIDIDVFVSDNGEIYINEINPRFGGGHPHAYGCGVNFMKMILNNMNGKINTPSFHKYQEGIYMMKYNGLVFRKLMK